jgi:hypothetical protein
MPPAADRRSVEILGRRAAADFQRLPLRQVLSGGAVVIQSIRAGAADSIGASGGIPIGAGHRNYKDLAKAN